ncbi:MAG: hypothetical protein C0603_11955 [Denitrovibrio sp.]|nr:MAG: hypothetical protein C0603_11955 [Denitrovibrio sp.]
MLKKVKATALPTLLLVALLLSIVSPAVAHEDDYIVGLSAFRDGLYDISKPSLDAYLAGETEERKADYSHYLLYQILLNRNDFKSSLKHLNAISSTKDRRYDTIRMAKDKMLLLTKTNCGEATAYLAESNDDTSLNYYLDSECKPEGDSIDMLINNAKSDKTKLKVIAKFPDNKELVTKVFDSLNFSNLSNDSKKYFALYFYSNGDMERFKQVRAIYEDADVVGLELDSLWKAGDRDGFIASYEDYRKKYKLKGANACRAIDIYKKSDTEFDCNLVNECMQKYSVDFVKLKGACLVKQGDNKKITAFIDSLKPTIFPGMCGYGEYVFHNDLYDGKAHNKFYQCEEKYKVADVLLKKGDYQAVVNMFLKKDKDMDKYYTAISLRKLGKTEAADATAGTIKEEALKLKYSGGTQ